MTIFHQRRTCRVCASPDVVVAVPLVPIPVLTPNISVDANGTDTARQVVPLDLYQCGGCGHLQLLHVINPEVQYNNFRYQTSISLGLPEHFRELARSLLSDLGSSMDAFVVELGSNDGTLLRAFKEAGARVLGVDPARSIAKAATESGIPTLARFFSNELAREIRDEHGAAHLIVANNTFANIDDLDDFLAGVRHLLRTDGVFVIETQYGSDVLANTLLETIYHEHLSYFMVRPLKILFERQGLELIDVSRIPTKGGSIRCTVQHRGGGRSVAPVVEAMIAEEHQAGLYDSRLPFQRFLDNIAEQKRRLHTLMGKARDQGQVIAGYGASVGSVALVQQFELGHILSFIADDKPLTDSIYGPDYRIPVIHAGELAERAPGLVVVLAWRYLKAIVDKNQAYLAAGGIFVSPLPSLSVAEEQGGSD